MEGTHHQHQHHHRIGETTGLSAADSGPSSNHHHHHHQYPSSSVFHGINSPTTTFFNQQGVSFDFGELEEAIVFQGIDQQIRNDAPKKPFHTSSRPATATLDMFPSWPMRIQQTPPKGSSKSGEESTDSGSAQNTISCKADSYNHHHHHQFGPGSPISTSVKVFDQSQQTQDYQKQQQQQLLKMASDVPRNGAAGPQQNLPKTSEKFLKFELNICPKMPQRKGPAISNSDKLDAKTLRRLAQNREAARKSRLRKKAYVQQLETSRIKLTQIEQDLQRARSQGLFLSAGVGGNGNLSSGAAMFDMEYTRWLDEDHRHLTELRSALHSQLQDGDLRMILDGYLAHYDEIFHLKIDAAKCDAFHLINGMWTTPAERCFLWMGGFRPSDILKIVLPQVDPLTEQQLMGICGLQQSSQQAEEALSQGLEQLHQSLAETIAGNSLNESANVGNYMGQMAVALGKLSNLEGFVRQADNLRQQTLHQLRRILTVRQAVRCFLAIGEYYNRLRALSSLWASRPRDHLNNLISDDNSCQTTTELQMVQTPHGSHNPFSAF
ncbi:transcription factor TGA2.3-like isoform X1 [Papaver somniferum]|uniref:transcription factor TGA2.3-like isoform X1 n=1 Tax=Papaver somniferum TaxID=3469 RepID=UPI000E6FB602|nr:transcription factor TGA2.3-like isoform X1 [Papaver somniferum]XP_026426011.1 transcription factor TGA2.3-like isoform X1 [Papaver somniferum]XP_026426013.1 transcription factor TGA2.3-like isoform X1 [Papaver somniferum]